MKYILIFLILSFFSLEAFEQLIDLEKIGGTKNPPHKVVFGKHTKKVNKKKQETVRTSVNKNIQKVITSNKKQTLLPAFISPMELKKILNDSNTIIIDTDSSKIYNKGHINNAINVNIHNFIKEELNPYHLMKSNSSIKNRIIDLGINKDSKVIIYSHNIDTTELNSSYLAFILITFGFENVSILNGGYMAWVFENERLVSSESFSAKDDGNFIPKKNQNIIVTQDYVLNNIANSKMLDARDSMYYYGTHKSPKTKAYGHIPNAKSSYYGNKFYIDKTLREKNELNEIYFQGFNLNKDEEVIVYADNIFVASMEWYILYKSMGFKNAKIYEASLVEYFRDSTNPKIRFKWE